MFNRKSKYTLEQLRADLIRRSQEVPGRAERFHTRCNDLLRQLEWAGQRWIGPGKKELDLLRQKVEQLGELAPDLVWLFQGVEAMQREILALRERAERGEMEQPLADWTRDRCFDWQSVLRRLGVNVVCRFELDQDLLTLERTQIQFFLHGDALDWLAATERILDHLGDLAEAASLRAGLPKMQQQLVKHGATAEWVAGIRARVRHLQPLIDGPREISPRRLQEVLPLLAEARRWCRVLGRGEERLLELEQGYQLAMSSWKDWGDHRSGGLLHETDRWLDELRRHAAERRADALASLERKYHDLEKAIGPSSEIESEIGDLLAQVVRGPEAYKDWMEQHRRIEERIAAHADAAWPGLATRSLPEPPASYGAVTDDIVEAPAPITDRVHFTATSPSWLAPGQSHILNIWVHLATQRDEVIERARETLGPDLRPYTKGPVPVRRGTVLTVRLQVQGLAVPEPEDTVFWEGEIGNANFRIDVPADATEGAYAGQATVHIDGLRIATLYFTVFVVRQDSAGATGALPLRELRHSKAFASYASPDEPSVLARIQGIQKGAPGIDIFYAPQFLRSGEIWRMRLAEEIKSRDIFYLFWSQAARESEYVDWEWRHALKTRGLGYIDPVPLVSPQEVPPPAELSDLHFNDWVLAWMNRAAPR